MNLARTLAIGTVLTATTAASASFVGLHLVEHAVDGNGTVPGTTTWRLYAEFDDPNDQVTRVHGDWPLPTVVISMDGYYQNPFGGPMSSNINAAFIGIIPSLGYDSWVTIGAEWSHESNTLNSTNINFSYFETVGITPGVLGFLNGELTRPQNDPYAYGVALSGLPNYHVLVGQFTTPGYGTSTAPWGVMSLNGYRDGFLFNGGGPIPWAANGVRFGTVPETAGACCIDDQVDTYCQVLTELACEHFGGEWYGAGTECTDADVTCSLDPDAGACCYAVAGGSACEILTQDQCDKMGVSYWYGSGIMCDDPDVQCAEEPEAGACCYPLDDSTLVCEVLGLQDCSLSGGYWYGAGSVCSDPFVECDPIPEGGACCYENAAAQLVCDEMMEVDCGTLGGYWYGAGSVCSDPFVECESPQNGACCIEEGQGSGNWFCVEITIKTCAENLGIWHGVGSLCSDDDVTCQPTGDCLAVPGSECARAPQYDDAAYQVFGNGEVAVQTAAPNVTGGRMVTVFDLTNINAAPLNTDFPINRYAHADWDVQHIGAVLGLALDESGNIFVSASQTWNADWSGPAGWGAVYRIDTNTAAVSTFAVLPTTNTSLGSITYDCENSQFFVSNFEDGLIYRLDYTTGSILDTFDHGTPWSGDPGPVALGDRPFAVEVNGDRLYYSLWNTDINNPSNTPNQIWSVRLDSAGRPDGGTERLEINLPAYDGGNYSSPVADLDFTPNGTMVLGERSQTGITSLSAHLARVLEYECLGSGWAPTSNIFTLGEWPESAAGGVDGTESNVWASADGMHIAAPDALYGFQGLPATGGSIVDSWLIDYNGNLSVQDKTLLGDLVIAPEGDDGNTGPDCPTIDVGSVMCMTPGPPAQFSMDINVTNTDDTDTISSVTLNVPSMYSLSPDSAALNLAPNASGGFSTVLTGGTPGAMFCIEVEVLFKSGATCYAEVCFALPNCIVFPPGDINGDYVVNVDDLVMLIGMWGEVCDGVDNDCNASDADDNGVVDMGDLLIVLENWS